MQPDQTFASSEWSEDRLNSRAVIPSVSIDALLVRRDAVASRISQMLALQHEVGSLLESIPFAAYPTRLQVAATHRTFDTVEDATLMVRSVDARIWDHLLKESGLWQLMDEAARNAWSNNIDRANVPDLTRENIDATFAELHRGRAAMFERGVVAVFRHLSWRYKANLPVAFGRRLVLRGVVRIWKHRGETEVYGPSYEGCHRLDDLLRVMTILDGKPEPAMSSHALLDKAGWPKTAQTTTLHDLVSLRGFKNGNAHLTFLRQDLVDRMNAIVARHYPNILPPARD